MKGYLATLDAVFDFKSIPPSGMTEKLFRQRSMQMLSQDALAAIIIKSLELRGLPAGFSLEQVFNQVNVSAGLLTKTRIHRLLDSVYSEVERQAREQIL